LSSSLRLRRSYIINAQRLLTGARYHADGNGLVMAGFQIRGIKWVRTPTFQESADTWRARRQAARESFESTTSAVLSAFKSINSDFATGMSSIAASTAVKRIQDDAKAKAAENAKSVDFSV
jgi:hypothetical protein